MHAVAPWHMCSNAGHQGTLNAPHRERDTLQQSLMADTRAHARRSRRTERPEPALPLTLEQQEAFRRALLAWYRLHARVLPWRNVDDPYRTWLSEIMLQQTRVDAVIDHFRRFLQRFPTLLSLALAPEEDVLALWSGLGYYRRARMLHRAAKFLVEEHAGILPRTARELRALPGIGAYTSAAIASIAFGEAVAVVDGNVERVLLRVAGRPAEPGTQAAAFVESLATAVLDKGSPGDSNQAMMELGATVCLPRGPLCLQCPVFDYCRTRGEHVTLPRAAMRSAVALYAITLRNVEGGTAVEVLLHRRESTLSLMPGMLELPPLHTAPNGAPRLRLRHAIVGTNYYVEVFSINTEAEVGDRMQTNGTGVQPDLALLWQPLNHLAGLPLTGLARKVLQRTSLMPTAFRQRSDQADHLQAGT